ncbi:uncharacterized protein si:dkey-20i10.7 isoform X2 [Hoplias malabaricus]|uniref:uncharacterized protein si:dkey-20i10.7 isoform X2 n=1 Tax=Hoplias malabaricus TaxID=27720 RepID=UPI0034626742
MAHTLAQVVKTRPPWLLSNRYYPPLFRSSAEGVSVSLVSAEMVKRCAWGDCKSDTRYPNRVEGVVFYPFPKPKTNFQKCEQWIRLCGRPQHRLNIHTISKNTYVCSKHFVNGGPSDEYPDPLDALDETNSPKICRQPPKKIQRCEEIVSRNESVEINPSSNTIQGRGGSGAYP